MSAIQSSIKHIQSSLPKHKNNNSFKSKIGLGDIIINGQKLPCFAYRKYSMTKRKKSKPTTFRTLPSQNIYRQDSLAFSNETLKKVLSIRSGSFKTDGYPLKCKKRQIIKEKVIIEGEVLNNFNIFIKIPKKQIASLKKSQKFYRNNQKSGILSFNIDRRIRSRSFRKHQENQRERSHNSQKKMSSFSERKMSESNLSLNNLIISQKDNPLNFKLNEKRKLVRHCRSFEEEDRQISSEEFYNSRRTEFNKTPTKVCFSHKINRKENISFLKTR